jgi:hypothetical protein
VTNPEKIKSIEVNGEVKCECGHHFLEHDGAKYLLTGEPPNCKRCDCPDYRPRDPTPWLKLLDEDGREVDPTGSG